MKLVVFMVGSDEPFYFYESEAKAALKSIEFALSKNATTTIPCSSGEGNTTFLTKNIAAYTIFNSY